MIARRAFARRWCVVAVLLGTTALASPVRSQDSSLAAIPAYEGYLTDRAHVFSDPARAQLESFLDQVHEKTGAQFAVLTVETTAPEAPESYKTRVFQAWGIGNKERDDGLLLLVAMQEHALRFETGYGLEGVLPDGWQGRMIRQVAVPLMRQGRSADGITQAVLQASERIATDKGVTLEWDGRELRYSQTRRSRFPPQLLALVFFLILSVLMRSAGGRGRRGPGMGGPWMGGGWGGGFGGGGGGFGGGGGGSFGGFGGGGSGGGGGGGNW
ncbi:MAG: TPM domain-containing protein [Candidatus Eisenbacteria bacterium]